jgi:hypothetical protein
MQTQKNSYPKLGANLMKARITLNGQDILTDEKKAAARVALLAVAVRDNPVSKTASGAYRDENGEVRIERIGAGFFSNAENVAAKLSEMGKPSDEVVFYEIPDGKTEETEAARGTLGTFVARLLVAANAKNLLMIVPVKKSDKPTGNKVAQDTDI